MLYSNQQMAFVTGSGLEKLHLSSLKSRTQESLAVYKRVQTGIARLQ